MLGCALIASLYGIFIVPGKDSTIQSLQTRLTNLPLEGVKVAPAQIESPKPAASRTQWYLKIKSIEVVPRTTNDHPQTIPFRIVAQVNSQNYSFPNAQLCFMGEATQGGEAMPLPMEREKYVIQFARQNIRRNFAKVSITNSFSLNQSSQTDFCEIKDLPLTKTNEVFTQDMQTGIDFGVTRIVYQIYEN